MRGFLSIVCLFLLLFQLPAKELLQLCGTSRLLAREEIFLHRQSMAARQKLGLPRAASGPAGVDIGDIAVMYASNGILAQRNPFNLVLKGITFLPSSEFTRYRFQTGNLSYDTDAVANGVLLEKLGDDDSRGAPLPFRFPFYGKTYSEFFINSNGDISFDRAMPAINAISAGAFGAGPPRIAPLYADLDPTFSVSGGVLYLADSSKAVVTWKEIPPYGSRSPQTFQLRFYPDGRIEFAYVAVTVGNAVVGISPGEVRNGTELVSFSGGSAGMYAGTVVERFSSSQSIDTVLLSQRFFETHEDAFDYLAVYNTLGIRPGGVNVATEQSVRTMYRSGFGDEALDFGKDYGSARRLQAYLDMGTMSDYPPDPSAPVPSRGSTGDTALTILSHETGHLFLALASIREAGNPDARPMLDSTLAHWSFNFNSEASFLGGNRIADNGQNSDPRFSTTATVQQYSPLDQYLMGFRMPEETPPVFLVRGSSKSADAFPLAGVSLNGTRQNIAVEDIIAAEGRRTPDTTVSQRRFRTAVVLLIPAGAEPPAAAIQQLETLRLQFEPFYQKAAGDRAFIETSLRKGLHLSMQPAAGVVAGAAIEAFVSLDRPAASDMKVMLRTEKGVASIPEWVMIPTGATRASFPLTGVAPGVEEISAEADDASYMRDFARVQVLANASDLKLHVIGGGAMVELRLADVNLIPYSGMRVTATVDNGSAEPSTAVTDIDGIARFRRPDSGVLTATVDGTSVSVKVMQ